MSRKSWNNRFTELLMLVGCIWCVYLVDTILHLSLSRFGIVPRQVNGLIGILCSPFLHGNLLHIFSNTIYLLIFGGLIAARSPRDFRRVTPVIILLSGLGVWLFGRNSIHIGASGLVFGYFGYIVTRGIFDRNFYSVLISVLVVLSFGGMLWGVLPTDGYISWEGHLFGLLGGCYLAARLKGRRR